MVGKAASSGGGSASASKKPACSATTVTVTPKTQKTTAPAPANQHTAMQPAAATAYCCVFVISQLPIFKNILHHLVRNTKIFVTDVRVKTIKLKWDLNAPRKMSPARYPMGALDNIHTLRSEKRKARDDLYQIKQKKDVAKQKVI